MADLAQVEAWLAGAAMLVALGALGTILRHEGHCNDRWSKLWDEERKNTAMLNRIAGKLGIDVGSDS